MLLRNSDFVPNSKIGLFENLHHNDAFVRKHTASTFIHMLTLGFAGGHFEEFFFIRDKKYSFDQIMKLINDMKGTRYPSYDIKKHLRELGEIKSGELSDVIETESYIVYVEKDEETKDK